MNAALKHPALHFLVAGAAIFAATRLAPSLSPDPARYRIVVTREQIQDLRGRSGGASGDEMAALIESAAVDEMLYREAVARGLDASDAVVERRLVQNMRFLGDQRSDDDAVLLGQARALGLRDGDPVIRRRLIHRMRSLLTQGNIDEPPTDKEMRSYFEKNRETFASHPTVRVSQIFFSGPDEIDKAGKTLARLTAEQTGPQAAADCGDPFITGADLPMHSERGLAKIFGAEAAHSCLSLPVGEWSGPVRSAHGVHLFWIHERPPVRTPPFEAVRERIRRELAAGRAEAALSRGIAVLRARYRVEVDDRPS